VIAPSLLYRPEIIIMDEATVSFDTGTNAKIQRIMRTDFKDSTFITMTKYLTDHHVSITMFPLKTSSIEMSPNADVVNGKSGAHGL
jgi:ABC-type bacteriocin/lantibiotic exporter with double-glycine peptidase domain